MKPILVVNPATDEVFAEFAQILVDHGAASIADLERRLRAVYPLAAVHTRELAAESFIIWYVSRDGRWGATRPVVDSTGGQVRDGRPTGRPSIDGGVDPARR
jgi:hypothetical protein